jgi:hypothetical protein
MKHIIVIKKSKWNLLVSVLGKGSGTKNVLYIDSSLLHLETIQYSFYNLLKKKTMFQFNLSKLGCTLYSGKC